MCRLQFYRNMQKKSTNPSIRTLVSFLQCRLLRVFRILPYAHPANPAAFLALLFYYYEFFIITLSTTFATSSQDLLQRSKRPKISVHTITSIGSAEPEYKL